MKPLALVLAISLAACSADDTPLVSSADIVGDGIPKPLSQAPGDETRGELIFTERERGHCVLCHIVDELDIEFQGNVGPELTAVGDRLTPSQLRLRVVDYQIVRPGTLMPSYYRNHDLYQLGRDYEGQPILSAQDVEDVVTYLATLRTETDDD